ncbi:MAG: transglycosylase domain-containing protein [Chloroflexi bacterium]|nr:transglycosylase domain-containing protein [Chloroflexota bacterium]
MSDRPETPGMEQPRNVWYKPDNALTDEQLDAQATLNLPHMMQEDLPGFQPERPGGWYTPPNAITVSEYGSVLDEDILSGIKPAESALLGELDEEPEPAVLDEDVVKGRDVPDAPVVFGHGDFRSAPQAPVDKPQDEGLGGLRDQVRGLEPSEVRHDEGIIAQAPSRGFGGVKGGDASQATRNLSDTGSLGGVQTPQPSGTGAMQPNPEAEKFRHVEEAVTALRQQYANGQMTRQQLETQLKQLVIMDEQGRWWTIGVDSNRWYRYDGREWIPDTPPQTGAPVVAGPGNFVPTETNVPSPQQGVTPHIELDDYGMPLPQRVPVDDPQATMVNLNAATSSNEEQTWDQSTIPSARVDPSRDIIPDPAAQQTISSAAAAQAVYGSDSLSAETMIGGYIEEAQPVPTGRKKDSDGQPDYSAAYGRSMDRSTVIRYGMWTGVIGIAVSLGVVLCVLLGMVAYYLSVINTYQDRLDNLGAQVSSFQTTRIYDANGQVIAQYNDPNTGARTEVPLEDISPWIIHATIATEDETFYENPGFSVFAILRAIYTNVTAEGPRSGASTITQQLVRALILDEAFAAEVSSERKITEIILAAELNRRYTKNEILELYLNEIYYGNLAYGVEAAAQVYFDKSASDLNVFEAAFLAGLPQAPAIYDPVRNRQVGLDRMDTVFRLMTQANDDGCIQMEHTTNVANFDLSTPLCVSENFRTEIYPIELAQVETTIFETPSFEPQYAHFVNWVWEQLELRYDVNDIYSTGFNVYTTLDPSLQNTAQQAVRDQLAVNPNINNGAVMTMDVRSGAVLAMVGSADFNSEEIDGQVNVLFTPQQPGSSIKPLVYLTAFEGINGEYFTPATIIWDTPSRWGNYEPLNFDREFRGPVTVRRALANSLNVPAVKALNFISPQRFEDRAEELGINFLLQTPSEAGLPSALGAVEVRLFDMISVYSAFANGGQRFQPFGITRIETTNGDVIFEHLPQLEGLPFDPAHAYLINSILSDAQARQEEFGAGGNLNLPGREAAVKTGTTDDSRDLLTIGWTPQIITGVWMGNTDNSPPGGRPTGFSVAAPVWNRVMQAATQNLPAESFPRPESVQGRQVCLDTGAEIPSAGCGPGGTSNEFFSINQPPPPASEGLIAVILVDPFTNRIANQFCSDYAEERTFLNTDDATAIAWLQSPAGQAWAQSRGLNTNVSTMPTDQCQEGQPRPEVTLLDPAASEVINGFVPVYGRAIVPNFVNYELQYAPASNPEAFVTILQRTAPPSSNNFLGDWDTSAIPDGPYILRVVAFSDTGAFADETIPVSVVNQTTQPEQPTQVFPTQAPGGEFGGSGESGGSTEPVPPEGQEAVPPAEAGQSG